jgi:hypothetical protein
VRPGFDSSFLERSALFWPIARAARRVFAPLGACEGFPPVEALGGVFEGDPPVRFSLAPPRARRRRPGPIDVSALYDARIAIERVVPTRADSWHDLMNALVWGTFPCAKAALHARQHRAIAERIEPGARKLPAARTRELDALALLDEGGVALLAKEPRALRDALRTDGPSSLGAHIASGAAEAIVFGHAIYESLALGIAPAVVAAILLDSPEEQAHPVGAVDELLARALEDRGRLRTPDELTRVTLPLSTSRVAWASHATARCPPSDESFRPLAPRDLPATAR